MFQWLKNRLTSEDPRQWRPELHDAGFRCFARRRCHEVRWSDIRLICTYKRDLFAYDLICIGFETSSGEFVEIDEQMNGFMAVVKQMEQTFPGIRSDWHRTVMLPAFEPNERVLWSSGDAQVDKTDQ